MPGTVPNPTLIIHMTHVSNLPQIIANGGLMTTSALQAGNAAFVNIAYSSIQQQRAGRLVPCGPGGTLHDYVPFYFASLSPMLYTIHMGNVPCEGGQENVIHLVSTAQRVAERGLGFVFTDGHGIMAYTDFYDDLAELHQVDWNMIREKYWRDTADDGDRKRRKQAEFLVHGHMPWRDIMHIVVRSAARQQQVAGLVAGQPHQPEVAVRPNWYY
jgi:hypothetical protein